MANIDDLSISVKSNVTSATNSIDKLITKLGTLSASLGQVDTSGFSAMASGVRQISNASKGLDGSASQKLAELSLAIRKFGSSTATQASANIPKLSSSIQQLVGSMNSIGSVNTESAEGLANISNALSKLGGAKVTQAVSNVPELTRSLQAMVGSVNQIGTAGNSVATLGQLASALSKLGGKTVTTAITNIPQLTSALLKMMDALSKAPQVSYNVIQLVNSLANLSSQGSKVGTASNSIYNGFMRFGKGADYARKKSFSLASAIGKLYAQYWLLLRAFRGIGTGITLASDLTEVQNVVDVAFGQYRSKIEDFAEVSIQDYGMSELTAKQIASRYQAMGGAIGFTQKEMADMSIALTKLTGDMASFYNVSQEAVAEDLEAIFTGQTRPLRTYGLDLTQATLQEWALSQGMEANIATMTQAEKVLLRYNYVMAQTAMAQGDFQRTQNTWANQIRVLRQQFEALGAVIGQNFIYAIKPIIQALNEVMAKIIQFARVVSNALGKIFGWKFDDTVGGITNDLEFGADAAEDLGGGLGGAADNAKKLKQQLQGFDELNVLTTNTPSSGGGGGGGGSLGNAISSVTGGQWVPDDEEKFFESDLDSLYKLGDYIGTTLTNQLRSIDWQEVYQGAKDFGKGLASFLNGLISPELFSATGATIAGALNTAIYSTLAFGEEFDFKELGLSIAESINTFFRDTDFRALGEDIRAWVVGLKTTLVTIIKETDWGEILKGIGDALSALDAETIVALFGFKALSMLFNRSLFSTLATGLAGVSVLPASLTSGLASIASQIQIGFVAGLTYAFVGFNIGEWIYEQITGDNTSDINYLDYFVGEGKASGEEWLNALKDLVGGELGDVESNLLGITKLAGEQGKAFKLLQGVLSKTGKEYKNFGLTSGASVQILEDGNLGIIESTDTLGQSLGNTWDVLKENSNKTWTEISNTIKENTGRSVNAVSTMANGVGTAMVNMSNVSGNSISQMVTSGVNGFNRLLDNSTNIFGKIQANGTNQFATLLTNATNSMQLLNSKTQAEGTSMASKMANAVNGMAENTISQFTNMVNTSVNKMKEFESGADNGLSKMLKVVQARMNTASGIVGGQNWYGSGTHLVQGLTNGISNQWNNNLVGRIISLAQTLTSKLKNAFGIHSPSRIWQDEVGYYLAEGLRLGVIGEEGHITRDIVGMGNRLTDSLSGSLTLATPSSLSSGYNLGVTSTMAHSFSADTSMTSNIANGVRQGLSASQAEQNALLREQNELLYQLLQKETISSDDVYNVVVNKNRDTFNRTGYNPLFA